MITKMRRLKISFFLGIVSLSLAVKGQTIYHIDPNNTNGMIPDNSRRARTTATDIKLSNDYSQNISIILSDNNKDWDTTKILANSSLLYKVPTKYLKIYTSTDVFSFVKLTLGNSYSIYWDNSKKKWDVR